MKTWAKPRQHTWAKPRKEYRLDETSEKDRLDETSETDRLDETSKKTRRTSSRYGQEKGRNPVQEKKPEKKKISAVQSSAAPGG
jgi:hypothetical protein